MSPKDSWKAATSWLMASQSWGRMASRTAWPSSWHTTSGLSPVKTMVPATFGVEEPQVTTGVDGIELVAGVEADRQVLPTCQEAPRGMTDFQKATARAKASAACPVAELLGAGS